MKKRQIAALCALTLCFGVAGAQDASRRKPVGLPGLDAPAVPPVSFVSSMADTYVVARFSFDNAGAPDPQGWTTVDRSAQTGTYWHVDTFNVPTGGGQQAAWCGVPVTATGPTCAYLCAPGYGNYWKQILETPVAFMTQGDVTLSYLISWDSEPGYDELDVQYLNKDGNWKRLVSLDGVATDVLQSHTIPAAELNGSVKFRFYFGSDGFYSDEDCFYDSDGAAQIDNIQVEDTTGVLHLEDFEGETIGAMMTDDGVWVSGVGTAFGDYAALFAGTEFVQEDPNFTNTTNLWAFVNGSTDTNGDWCADPDTMIVPFRKYPPGEWEIHLWNDIWSPMIDITSDENSVPIPSSADVTILRFRYYVDVDFGDLNEVMMRWGVRSLQSPATCQGVAWQTDGPYFSPSKQWTTFEVDLGPYTDPQADLLQIALTALDWCASDPSCDLAIAPCHSQAPFFDDVEVIRIDTTTVTGLGDTPTIGYALQQNIPNPFNPTTTIRYSIAEPGRVSLRVYSPSGALVRTLVDAEQTPRAGGFAIEWNGRNDLGKQVSSGVYFYKLETRGFTETKKMVLLK